jgi:hypothetical protein
VFRRHPEARREDTKADTGARAAWREPATWGIVGLAFALRLGLLLRYPDLVARADESLHLIAGALVAHVGPAAVGHWAPGYELFLAGIFRVAGVDPFPAKLVQVIVSTGVVALTLALARAAGGRCAGWIAGGLAALHPSLVAYSHYLYSETLFGALLLAASFVYHRRADGPSRGEQVVAGLLFGAAILTRSVALYFLPLWIAFEALRRRGAEMRRVSVVFAVALLVVAPWTLRNAMRFHAFVPVDSTLAMTAHFAFQPSVFNRDLGASFDLAGWRTPCPPIRLEPRPPIPPPRAMRAMLPPGAATVIEDGEAGLAIKLRQIQTWALTDWPPVQRCEVSNALRFAFERPGTVLRNALRRVHDFWGPNSFLLRAVYLGDYRAPPLDRPRYAAVRTLFVVFHLVVVGAAILAPGRRDAPPLVGWVALLAAYTTVLHALTVAFSRYRLPLVPLLITVAALWLARPERPRGPRGAVCVALLLGFGALWLYYALP